MLVVRYYVDDGTLTRGGTHFQDGARRRQATQPLASKHFRLLGIREPCNSPVLPPSKVSNWSTTIEFRGWWRDTHGLAFGPDPKKRNKLLKTRRLNASR